MDFSPKHTLIVKDLTNFNGIYTPNEAIYVQSGSIGPLVGSTTGSISFQLDAVAVKVVRVEVFHSGSKPSGEPGLNNNFNLSIENSASNSRT